MKITSLSALGKVAMQPYIKKQIEVALNSIKKKKTKRSKYRNKPVRIDGHYFPSTWEGEGYCDLKLRKMAGDIVDFKMQVPFVIKINNKKMYEYRADFVVYFNNGSIEVWDYKGIRTPMYSLKKKMVQEEYGITIIEKYKKGKNNGCK